MEQDTPTLFEDLKRGDSAALSRSITLIESVNAGHFSAAEELLEMCLPHSGKSMRIGITGVPGVGKSTFIEAFGKHLTKLKKKVAVLAIDPSSTRSRGSILGDKTRMPALASDKKAFIRPSPSSGALGGVSSATRESIILCEAAGYDVILVETVGVGQSEMEVREMTDFFLLLILPGSGDELQGMKRGIVEASDAILINKADGSNMARARETLSAYRSALKLFPARESDWKPMAELCSSLDGMNIGKAWEIALQYFKQTKYNGYFKKCRKDQVKRWFAASVESSIYRKYSSLPGFEKKYSRVEGDVAAGKLTPRKASRLFLSQLKPG